MKKIIILMLMLPIIAQAQIKLQPKVAMSYGHENIRLVDEQMYRYDYHLPNFCFRTGVARGGMYGGGDIISISYGY